MGTTNVRTRFAPSPTGFLHIGGVRTAIFNWALARRHGGQFVLRIDDTDVQRHQAEVLQPILDGLRWLGLNWDEGPGVEGPHGPYFQSQRQELYARYAEELLERGAVYPCFCSPEQLERERQEARAAKRPYRYSGRCRALSAEERTSRRDAGEPYVLRLRVEPGETVRFTDVILGPVERSTDDIGDVVLVRANGIPLYNFATVVDDLTMNITHVIRAQEHLSNTFVQLLIYRALDASPPEFAHVPYVAAPGSKAKLSKRHLDRYQTPENTERFLRLGFRPDEVPNPVMLDYYIHLGYLPDAVLNGLARLGWSLDDRTEKIPRELLIREFSLERVHKSPASFDPDKLYWLQGEYMRELPLEEKVEGAIPFLHRARLVETPVPPETRRLLRRVIEALGDRMKLFTDVIVYGGFFFQDLPHYDPRAVRKVLLQPNAAQVLQELAARLASLEPFTAERIERVVRGLAAELGVGAGKVIHPLRVATSGQTIGPGVFELVEILGKERALKRIAHALELIAAQQDPQ